MMEEEEVVVVEVVVAVRIVGWVVLGGVVNSKKMTAHVAQQQRMPSKGDRSLGHKPWLAWFSVSLIAADREVVSKTIRFAARLPCLVLFRLARLYDR